LTGVRIFRIMPPRPRRMPIAAHHLPAWTNRLRIAVAAVAVALPAYFVLMFAYGASPLATAVGYAPVQPIPYSHAMHAGQLGLDCRYCHTTVERAAEAALPPTQTCTNCHSQKYGILRDSEKLAVLHEALYSNDPQKKGLPIPWVRVHDLPDYVYFNHSAHVTRGVGCVSCHGRIDRMEVVYQAKPLSMGWCLECHRNPAPNLRPPEAITDLMWTPPEGLPAEEYGQRLMKEYNIRGPEYMQSCSTCHR
jgi:menaquinone reductase, multiheme cytochrome c subunit